MLFSDPKQTDFKLNTGTPLQTTKQRKFKNHMSQYKTQDKRVNQLKSICLKCIINKKSVLHFLPTDNPFCNPNRTIHNP